MCDGVMVLSRLFGRFCTIPGIIEHVCRSSRDYGAAAVCHSFDGVTRAC